MRQFPIAKSIVGLLLAFAAGVTAQVGAEVALRTAIEKETVKGDLKGAIDQYKKLAQGKDRAVAAKALVHMGQCYDKLGDVEAGKAWERVVREFADQKEAVAEARKHLEAKTTQAGTGPIIRQIEKVGDRQYGSFSKDGRYGAFTYQGGRVGLHDLVTGDQKNLVVRKSPQETLFGAMISPDGKLVAYSRQNQISEILVIGTDGSNPRTLAGDQDVNASCSSWSPDGKYLLAVFNRRQPQGGRRAELGVLSVADGSFTAIGPGGYGARFSPDGSQIAFVRMSSAGGKSDIYVQSVKGGPEILVVENAGLASNPLWAPDGKRLLFLRNRGDTTDLWTIGMVDGKPAGSIEFVRNGIDRLIDVTSEGEYFYRTAIRARDVYVASLDPQTGRLTSPSKRITNRQFNGGAAWSPDGESIAYYSWQNNERHIVIRSAETGEERDLLPKLTSQPLSDQPVWFPDGRSLLLHSYDGKLTQVDVKTGDCRVLLNGAGVTPYPFHPNGYAAFDTDVILAGDGRSMYYFAAQDGPKQTRIVRFDLQDKSEREISRFDGVGSRLALSPNGAQLVFNASRPGPDGKPEPAIVMISTAGGEPREVCRCGNGDFFNWTKDGQHLLFTKWRATAQWDLYVVPTAGGEPQPLGLTPNHELHFLNIHPDGTQIVFSDEQWNSHLWGMKNLFPENKKAR